MNDLFANIFEVWFRIYDSNYVLIFRTLFTENVYGTFGGLSLVIPLILIFPFYFIWKYPYANFWHWLLWVIIISLVQAAIAWAIYEDTIFLSTNPDLQDALASQETGYNDYANSLTKKYALISGFLALIFSFLYSLILKQFSKVQIHLPF